ncbi:MAG: CoA protein activase [Syntrophaceticus sp.]|nr:CoA protein activase [Syntrophaceticus sp.]HBG21793.1 CoA protein activase [Peptococcaceae bacterium]
MKLTFPHMGYSYVAFKMLIEDLGYEVVVPPEPSKRTMDLGVRYSPEFSCIPFKVLLGTFLETIEMGAEVGISSGGVGPCRAGYYSIMQQKIINELGHDFKILSFEPPQSNYLDFIKKLWMIKPKRMSWRTFIQLIKKGYKKLEITDEIEFLMYRYMPYEINKGDTAKAFKTALDMLDEAQTVDDIEDARWEGIKVLAKVPQDRSQTPLKIGIIGEIYVVLEHAVNFCIQKNLGEMGVYTDRSIWLTSYAEKNVFVEGREGERDVFQMAHPYLNEMIGGHGINSIGEIVIYAKDGYDGVIQLAPFSCIPEIMAKGIVPRVSREEGIPVMTVFIDEQTAAAGLVTRLEAFIDLLKRRREQNADKRQLA